MNIANITIGSKRNITILQINVHTSHVHNAHLMLIKYFLNSWNTMYRCTNYILDDKKLSEAKTSVSIFLLTNLRQVIDSDFDLLKLIPWNWLNMWITYSWLNIKYSRFTKPASMCIYRLWKSTIILENELDKYTCWNGSTTSI